MPVHCVMIRLAYGPDYSDRYSKTVDVIRGQATGYVWEEPTSSYIFESPLNAKSLCDAIYYAAPIYDNKDTLVVINLSWTGDGHYAQRGAEYPATLAGLMAAR